MVSKDSDYKIRTITKEEVKIFVDWANQESWNPTNRDAYALFDAYSEGFFVGELNGEIIAIITATKYKKLYCHIGHYIVKPEFRGKGYGLKLFQHAVDYAKDVEVLGLDGVTPQKKNYEKSGFVSYGAVNRYEKKAAGVSHDHLVDLKKIPFEQLLEYDGNVFGEVREGFVKVILNQEGHHGLGIIKEDKLIGYGIIRKADVGYRIAPFFADDQKTAREILEGLENLVKGEDVFIDLFESNPDTRGLLDTTEWKPIFEMWRMYAKGVAKMDVSRIYSVVVEFA